MDNRGEIKDFLTTRRGRIRPEQVGLPAGSNRRVPGLRRSEVATLAGLSVEYYSRIERGDLAGVSDAVLAALARTLELDDAEHDHLLDLAHAATPSARTRRPPQQKSTSIRPALQSMLDAMTGAAAFVCNASQDMLATNHLARGLYSAMYDSAERPINHSRFIFLDPRSQIIYPNWQRAADTNVAILRTESGRHPHDRRLAQVIGELSMRSEEFRGRWAAHHVRRHVSGTKTFRHHIVGDIELGFEAMPLPGDTGLTLTVYTPAPNSPAEEAMRLLGSWLADNNSRTSQDSTNRT
ncbi:helix-turn-helix transcriptional regulator [Williamsia herbipolensis]|uniref:Helix-turn-helix transcriptional regulator n=1 Tax=Williamsia herbipolensis TaxID=1603258 RepID=A0AAU4JZ84_9NOCA|nr:helix-turn-helix transcriptional regulator [Williamsia herbipolensis]